MTKEQAERITDAVIGVIKAQMRDALESRPVNCDRDKEIKLDCDFASDMLVAALTEE